jgi:hypothetical protein
MSAPPDDPAGPPDALDELIRAARRAPWPKSADRLAIGFGARVEARLRTEAEVTDAGRLLGRWLAGLGMVSAVLLLIAGTATRPSTDSPHQAAVAESPLQSTWAGLTALPESWSDR